MSKEIDERVAELRLENSNFEQNAKTSIGTLGKLEAALDLSGAAKGFQEVNKETKRFDFSPLSNGVETVKAKFSALEVMAVTALANITNSAVNAGKKLVASFTIEPIKTGLAEYETQINAVQTILANTKSKGTTLDDVNSALDELNAYADKTIYNFTEMTRNIGTFTAAGVELDTSVQAIKGIANLAAISGSTSQQASTAMYQLSQALSSGTVKLQDWNSVVNAGMGGQVFQDSLKETARAHGIAIDEMIESEGSFRETLQKGWLSSEILTETLSKFTGDLSKEQLKSMGYTDEQIKSILELGETANNAATKVKTFTQLMDTLKEAAQSGWTQTWEILVGDFEEAKELWTTVSDVFGKIIQSSSDARNNMLQGWSDLGGRATLIESLQNAFKGLVSAVKPIKEAFLEIFPHVTSEQLFKFTEGLRDLTAKFTLSAKHAEQVKTAFKGLFSIIDIVITAVKSIVSGIVSLLGHLTRLGEGLLKSSASFGEWMSNIRDSVKETNVFAKAVDAIVKVLGTCIDEIKSFVSAVKQKFDAAGFNSFLDILKAIWGFMGKIAGGVKKVASIISSTLSDVFKIDGLNGLMNLLNGGLFAAFLANLPKFLKNISGAFESLSDIFDGVIGILDGVKESLNAFTQDIKAGTLQKIATSVAILAASLTVLSLIDSEKLGTALSGMTLLFVELLGTLSIFNKLNLNLSGVSKTISMMIGMASAILILASALKKISSLDWEELAVGLTGVIGLTATIVGASAALSKIEGKVMKGATSIVIFSSAIKILASACTDLAALSWSELAKGLVGVGGLLAEIDIFLNTAKFDKKASGAAFGIIELSAAIKILASAAGNFAGMKWEEIGKGLTGIGGLLTELVVFIKLTSNAKKLTATGLGLIELGAAMKIFASACSDFGKMSWMEIAKGLSAMGGALVEITIALKLMPKNVMSLGAGLVEVGAALNIIAVALGNMGGMTWGEIAKGLTSLGGSMGILAIGLNAMKGTLGASAALTVAATALGLLVPELKILGSMSIQEVGIALVGLAGGLTVLGIAAKILKPLAGTMIKISAAVALFGTGCALAGAGILAVSIALTALSASIIVVAASIGEVITELCNGIANSADAISRALIALVKSACVALEETVPYVTKAVLKLLVDAISSMKEYIPQIVNLIMDVLIQLMDTLTIRIPELVNKAVEMLGGFMQAVNNALGDNGWEKLILSITAISGVFLALAAAAKLISTIEIKGAVKGIAGFAVVVAGMAALLAALGGLAQIPGLDWLIGEGAKILAGIGYALGALVGSLVNGLVTNMPSDLGQFLTVMTEVGAMIAALEPLSSIISEIDFKGAAKGMAGVGIMVGGLTALLAALGGLNQIPGFEWIISEGSKVLGMLGTAIGNAVGSIVQGLTNAVTSDITEVLGDIASVASVIGATAGVGKILSTLKLDPVAVAKSGAAVAVLIGEVAAVLAILGGLKQIPGFDWIMSEGSQVLAQIGYAIGDFVGSIVGGLGAGITSGLPEMGDNLSAFMTSVQPFLDGAKNIDDTVMKGILSLSAAILCITAADLISGIASFLTGGSSIAKFGEEIAAFGPYIKQFSDSVAGVNNENVVAAANAAKALADMADTVPNEGGVAAWFAGENSVSKFGADIASFGKDLKTFSDNVTGINPENIQAAANAGKALAEMAETIPNEGGVAAWFAGENSVSKFGADIESFGTNLSNFSVNAQNVNPEKVVAAANAAKTLAEMANAIPNTGGMAAWFAGENSVAAFGTEIEKFGTNLSNFSVNASSVDPERVTAAANAAKTLAEMANMVPNEGGMASWFAGENNVAKFGADIESFGTNLSNFSNNAKSVDPPKVTAAATAAKSLVEIANSIPNTGGVASWFAGDNNIAAFGADIESFGTNMSNFSKNANAVEPNKVTAAAEAAKTLIGIANTIPNTGGVASWFAGDNNIAAFGADIESFGTNISNFSKNANSVEPETVTAAATAAKSLIEIANMVPNTGGVVSWFAGDTSLSKFGNDIASFGTSLNSFSKNVTGISPENVTAAAQAGKTLAELTSTVPNSGGVKAWFTGEQSLSKFGGQIADFGKHIKSFSNNVTGLDVAAVSAASEAGKTLVGMTNTIPQTVNVEGFGKGIVEIAKKVSEFTKIISGLNVSGSVYQVDQIISMVRNIQNANIASLTTLGNALQSVASEGVSKFVKAFDDSATKVKNAITNLLNKAIETITNTKTDFYNSGKTILGKFIDGVKAQETYSKNTFSSIINACLTILKNKFFEFENTGRTIMLRFISGVSSQSSSVSGYFTSGLSDALSEIRAFHEQFYGAGEYLVDGFVDGIKDNIYYAKEAAKKMAQESSKAAKEALDINSPSKVFYQIGAYSGIGFVNALDDYGRASYKSGEDMANYAKQGLATAISKISEIVEDGIDAQPTIRPVLDLSEVKLGTRNLDALLSHEQAISIGASINSANSENIQNEPSSVANGGVTFVQNNYSPKALSRVEIYRQTNNQISRMRGLART